MLSTMWSRSIANHAFALCFRPYRHFSSCKTSFSPSSSMEGIPSGICINSSSSRGGYKNAVLTSDWSISRSQVAACARQALTVSLRTVGAQVLWKSTPLTCENPLATMRHLYLSSWSPIIFFLKTSLHRMARRPGGISRQRRTVQVSRSFKERTSSS